MKLLIALLLMIQMASGPPADFSTSDGFKLYFLDPSNPLEEAYEMQHSEGSFTYGIIGEPQKLASKAEAYALIKKQQFLYVMPPSGGFLFVHPKGFDIMPPKEAP